MATSAIGLTLAAMGAFALAGPAAAQVNAHDEGRTGRAVAHDECTAGNICFWSERGFRGQKTVYKSALVECTRIIKPSAGAPAHLMTARSMKNRTDRTIVLGYNDPLCLIPHSVTASQTPLHLAPLSDNPDLGEGIRYIRTT